jgi:hypothetical protein
VSTGVLPRQHTGLSHHTLYKLVIPRLPTNRTGPGRSCVLYFCSVWIV